MNRLVPMCIIERWDSDDRQRMRNQYIRIEAWNEYSKDACFHYATEKCAIVAHIAKYGYLYCKYLLYRTEHVRAKETSRAKISRNNSKRIRDETGDVFGIIVHMRSKMLFSDYALEEVKVLWAEGCQSRSIRRSKLSILHAEQRSHLLFCSESDYTQ